VPAIQLDALRMLLQEVRNLFSNFFVPAKGFLRGRQNHLARTYSAVLTYDLDAGYASLLLRPGPFSG
jgi:hypothetical protein